MALPVQKPRMLLADKGYDGDAVRQNLLIRGIMPVIPPRANRVEPIHCDFTRYKDRNRIDRMFNKLKQFRRIATRYEKTAMSFLGFLNLAAAKLWLPTLSTGPNRPGHRRPRSVRSNEEPAAHDPYRKRHYDYEIVPMSWKVPQPIIFLMTRALPHSTGSP